MICDECETVAHCTSHGCIPKTTKKDEAMKLALKTLERVSEEFRIHQMDAAITKLKDALDGKAPEKQEPVTCRYGDNGYACCEGGPCAAEEHNDKTDWQERGMVAEAALAKLLDEKQEPVAVVSGYYGGQCVILPIDPARILNSNTALYTSPPTLSLAQRKPASNGWKLVPIEPTNEMMRAFFEAAGKWVNEEGADKDVYIAMLEAAPNSHECTRSHPHENMDAMCELRTEIARLANENARLKAQPAPVQELVPTVYLYRLPDGNTQVMAPNINDPAFVIDMLEEGIRAMNEGQPITRN